MRKSISDIVKETMLARGYWYIGWTTGYSLKKGSNLHRELCRTAAHLDWSHVVVREGAKMRHKSEGTELLIFFHPRIRR